MKLWLTWKAHGDAGFADRIDHAVAIADHVRSAIAESGDRFAPVVAGEFTNVCFLWVPPELRPIELGTLAEEDHERVHALAPRVKARMQDDGTALMGYQPVVRDQLLPAAVHESTGHHRGCRHPARSDRSLRDEGVEFVAWVGVRDRCCLPLTAGSRCAR